MKTITELSALRHERGLLPEPVGLVPTMGFLHEGHLSLVRVAKAQCANVITSIFVNPSQFGHNEDLDRYPRNLKRDLRLLANEGVDLVWTPTVEIMYPIDYQTWVNVENVTKRLEGEMRPGHFRGVATVVAKLFNATQPNKAYFGQKDAQQVVVIQQMVKDLNFPIEIIVCPTVRESDGLAMSSRNSYLNPAERQAATILYCALMAAQKSFNDGEREAEKLRQIVQQSVSQEPLATLQYVSCAKPHSLEELEGTISGTALLSMAIFIGKTHLIDNIFLGD